MLDAQVLVYREYQLEKVFRQEGRRPRHPTQGEAAHGSIDDTTLVVQGTGLMRVRDGGNQAAWNLELPLHSHHIKRFRNWDAGFP